MNRNVGILGALLLSSCVGDPGFGVTVTNRCETSVSFNLDGGRPRSGAAVLKLASGVAETYSVIAGERGAFLRLSDPAIGDLLIPTPPDGENADVVLVGVPCAATLR